MLDASSKFSIPGESPSQYIRFWLASVLPLHLVPQKGDGGETEFEMHFRFLVGEVGQETSRK